MKKRSEKGQSKKLLRRQKSRASKKSSRSRAEKFSTACQLSKFREPAFPIVGVGASAGGLEAFRELLTHLPTNTGMGFVLVQHLAPDRQSALTQLLTRGSAMPVEEVSNNQRVEPNHVYVIPPKTNLVISKGVLK